VTVYGLKNMVRLNQRVGGTYTKEWVRETEEGVNIHQTQSLLERIDALPHAQWQGDVQNYD